MAYVDHAFSIPDEDIMVETSNNYRTRPPLKEISLAVSLLVFGALAIIVGISIAYSRIGGDRVHGVSIAVLGAAVVIPGYYYTRMACYAFMGYRGNNILCMDE